jgi:Cu-Zn family superoxide dismutase
MHGDIIDGSGKSMGKVTGRSSNDGLIVAFDVSGLSAGQHAVHLHEVGRCDPPRFASAGAHWNVSRHEHGNDNPKGPHDGDWDNVDVGADGKGSTDRLIGRWHTAIPRAELAMIIHAGRDDEMSQPEGNSGERVGCAVIIPPG